MHKPVIKLPLKKAVQQISLKKQVIFYIVVLFCLLPLKGLAQISYNPVSMGLGGGGTSYINDYEALFINPANLQLREKNYRLQFSFAESGAYIDTPLRITDWGDRFDTYTSLMQTSSATRFALSHEDRESLLSRHFSNGRTSRQFTSTSTINWLGVKWFSEERSYAIAARTRQGSRFTVGRGFYQDFISESGSVEQINRSLSHDFQTLHELSFGYSESFSFLSGLFPRISRFIIGIAPKVVVSGSSFSTRYSNTYSREGNDPWRNDSFYSFESTGAFTEPAERLLSGNEPFANQAGISRLSEISSPTGIGGAIDLGITYIFTFGDDLSLIRRGVEPTEKSLRLSLSVTDLGAIYYFEDPLRAEWEEADSRVQNPGPLSDTFYAGALLQDFHFLSENGGHPLQSARSQDRDNYHSLLPTSLQSGILFQINRIKVMGDFQLGLTENAFQSTKLTSYIGAEIRPLSFLPLRAGTRLATDLPGYYSFGAGIETRYFDLNAAVQFRSTSAGPSLEPVAASVAALKFYIP